MSESPQAPTPPAPPVPPQPPARSKSGTTIAILLIIFGLIMVLGVMGMILGVRILSHSVIQVKNEGHGNKEVTIRTPLGSMHVSGNDKSEFIGLPVYPGAVRVAHNGSASVDLDLPGSHDVQVAAQSYETGDSLEKVKAYYKTQLGSEVTKYTARDSQGQTVFQIKRQEEEKIVTLKESDGKTRIALVRVYHGNATTN